MSLDIASVRLSLSSFGLMASKRGGSKDINGSATREEVERVSMSVSIYEDTKLIADKDIKLKC